MKYFKKNSKIYLIPLIFVISIIPLIVYLKIIKLGDFLSQYWTNDINMDFFSYHKAVLLIMSAITGIILFFIYLSRNNKIKNTKYYIPLAIYSLFVFLSSIFSETPYVAFLGFPDRFEGLFVLLSYMIIIFLTINLINDKKSIKILLIALIISACILGVMGILQYFGLDFLQSEFGKKLILPKKHHNLINKIKFKYESDIIYSTMFNPNYVGSYTAMLFSLIFSLYILIKENKYKIILGAISLIMFAYWFGSTSRAGMLSGSISLVLLFILIRNHLINNLKYIAVIIVCFLLILFAMNSYSGGRVMEDINSFGEETQIALKGNVNKAKIDDIILKGNKVTLKMSNLNLKIILENNKIKFLSESEKLIPYNYDKKNGNIELLKEKYNNHNFNFNPENNVLKWEYIDKQALFKITPKGFYIIGNNNKAYKELAEIKSIGFKGKERLGSHRGYIWSRSLPLLKNTWFLGFGADTYAIHFPQKDWLGILKAFDKTTKIIDKPHNMYLQIAINTGIPSLLAILSLFIIYFYQSIKLYWNIEFNDIYTKVGVGTMVSVVGYCIAGIFNDSVVSVAPVFWILLGMGISINLKLKGRRGN